MKPLILLTILTFSSVNLFAQKNELKMTQESTWTKFKPYVPEKNEFAIELGSMWESQNLYWLGGSMGFHIGRCMFSLSQSCQQYADVIAGAGGRDGQTNGLVLSGLRWQFIDLNDKYVPSVSLLAGMMSLKDNTRDKNVFAYGISYGFTTALHERLDLKFEIRAGRAQDYWSQSFLSFSIKLDKWVDYFAKKLDNLGVAGKVIKGTAEFTGKVIQETVEGSGKVIRGTVGTTNTVIEKTGEVTGKAIDATTDVIKSTGDAILPTNKDSKNKK